MAQVELLLEAHDTVDGVEERRALTLIRLATNGDNEGVQAWLNRRKSAGTDIDPDKQTGSATYL